MYKYGSGLTHQSQQQHSAVAAPPQRRASGQQQQQHRERLRRFYTKVHPSKVSQIDEILSQWVGKEDEMFDALEEKYKTSSKLSDLTSSGNTPQDAALNPQQQQQHDLSAASYVGQQGPFGNTTNLLSEEQQQQLEASSRMPLPLLPEEAVVNHYQNEALPNMNRALTQIQEAYSKLAESIAVANSKGADVSRSAPWIVSAQLGAANFIASAKQYMTLASDEDLRLRDYNNRLAQVATAQAVSGGGAGASGQSGVVRASASTQQQQQQQQTPRQQQQGAGGGGGSGGKKQQQGDRTVFDVSPLGGEKHVVADLMHAHAKPGDLIVLHPGIYRENLVVRNDIEIRVAATAQTVSSGGGGGGGGDQQQQEQQEEVLFLPADASMPTIQVVGETRCALHGLHFCKIDKLGNPLLSAGQYSSRGPAHQDGVPHVSLTGKAKMALSSCTFTSGGGGVVCVGHTELQCTMSLFRGCAFAGVYAKDASFVELTDVKCADCEVGVRIRDATLSMMRCEIVRAAADGLILHGSAKSEVERGVISDCGDNGVLLSSACEIALTDCRIIGCGKWGVDAARGADFAVIRGMVVRNASGPMSRHPTSKSG